MLDKNIMYGNINELEAVSTREESIEDNVKVINGTIGITSKAKRKKVLLVKFNKRNYVELEKLKTMKDIIGVYKDILFNTKNYVIKPYVEEFEIIADSDFNITVNADEHIDTESLEPYNKNSVKNVNILTLSKSLYK